MSSLALIIRQTRNGWAVGLTDGSEIARFRGFGSKQRALRFLTAYIGR